LHPTTLFSNIVKNNKQIESTLKRKVSDFISQISGFFKDQGKNGLGI